MCSRPSVWMIIDNDWQHVCKAGVAFTSAGQALEIFGVSLSGTIQHPLVYRNGGHTTIDCHFCWGFVWLCQACPPPFILNFDTPGSAIDSGTTCIVSSLWLDFFFRTFDITTQGGLIVCGAGNEIFLHVRLQTAFETQVRMPKDVAAVPILLKTAIPSATICWRQLGFLQWLITAEHAFTIIHQLVDRVTWCDMSGHVIIAGFVPRELRWFPSADSPGWHL